MCRVLGAAGDGDSCHPDRHNPASQYPEMPFLLLLLLPLGITDLQPLLASLASSYMDFELASFPHALPINSCPSISHDGSRLVAAESAGSRRKQRNDSKRKTTTTTTTTTTVAPVIEEVRMNIIRPGGF